MNTRHGVLSLLTILLVFVVIGGGVTWRLLRTGDEGATAPTRPESPGTTGLSVASASLFGESRPVEAVPVVRDTLRLHVVAAGGADATRRSPVATRTAGVVQQVLVREGDLVRAGDVLVRLDTVQAGMNLIRARSALTQAEARYQERTLYAADARDLLRPGELANRERVVRFETGLTSAELDLAERELELELTRVRALFDGHIADLTAVPGAFVGSGAVVLTLVQLQPIKVSVDVLESEIGLAAPGGRATVRFSALGGETLAATVESVNPRVDAETRTGRVTVSLPNPGYRILPGYYAWVSLETEVFPDRILIPRRAVTTRGPMHRDVVFLLKDDDGDGRGLADWKYVTLGRGNETLVEVVPSDDTSMLEPGDIVLVAGHHYLAHDTPVHVVEDVMAAGGTPGR